MLVICVEGRLDLFLGVVFTEELELAPVELVVTFAPVIINMHLYKLRGYIHTWDNTYSTPPKNLSSAR